MKQLNNHINLIVTQKSIINSWKEHFEKYYPLDFTIVDATKEKIDFVMKSIEVNTSPTVVLINYELLFRRKEFLNLKDITLVCDESGLIANELAKRTKFIFKLNCKNVILLSGTLCGGKYEKLWSQLHLLGWNISKDLYWRQYVDVEYLDNEGFPIKVVRGYKNVDRLKSKLREHGARFLKTDEVFDLPEQIFNLVNVNTTKEYRTFKKSRIIEIQRREFVGDTTLTKMLYERMLCGSYNNEKLEALKDLISSTEDRLIVFYNFNEELRAIEDICLELDRPVSIVNGQTKDLSCYEEYENSITAIQYQAGAMGLNLQKANKIVYFTPTLSSELFEQSKKELTG